MVTVQNVQISSEDAMTNPSVTAHQPATKVETTSANDSTPSPAITTDKNNGNDRPNNKRSSIDSAFFKAIARRRMNNVNSVVHSKFTPEAAGHVHVMCHSSDSHSNSSLSDGLKTQKGYNWWFHPLSPLRFNAVQSQWKGVFACSPKSKVAASKESSAIHAWNDQILKTIQSIIDLNDTAIDCYGVGEYNASLEALHEAQFNKKSLKTSLLLKTVSPDGCSTTDDSCFSDEKCTHHDTSQNTKTAARSSYIYQRMDFDEGMHSYASLEKIDRSDVIDVDPSKQNPIKVKIAVVQAILLFNIGQVYRRRGDFDGAASKYESALEAIQSTNFDKHQLFTPILHNIGQLQYRRGELIAAMKTYKHALSHAKSIDDGTVHVASALNCLGVLHYHANSSDNDDNSGKSYLNNMGDSSIDKAMKLFQQALSLRKQCLGPDHVDVATTLNNIGRIHVHCNEFVEALNYYNDALLIRRNTLGTDSLDYAATAFNTGQSLHQKGDLNAAVELYHEFLRVATIKFGKSHRDVAMVLSGIAQINQEQKNYDKALELYEESFLAGKAALGEYHCEIAMLLNRMGNFHFEMERFSDALKCYKRGLHIEKKVLPPDHPNIIVTYSNLGEIHRYRSEWDEAICMYSEALDILKKKHIGGDNADIATTLNTIGLINDQKGDSSLSLNFLQTALAMRRRLVVADPKGNDQAKLDVAATLFSIGTILYRKTLFSAALELFTESLELRQIFLGKNHREIAFVMYNIANVHQQTGDYERSIEFYTETLRIEKIVLGERHKDICLTLYKLGEVNKAAGKTAAALQCFQESLETERSLSNNTSHAVERRKHNSSGPDPAAMARTLTEIGNIHLANGDIVPMMEAFNEASRLYRSAGLSPHNIVISGQHTYAIDFSFPEAAPAA